ncbi:uncharacterized protein CBL_01581 [Carabus blaptoides fortunei]
MIIHQLLVCLLVYINLSIAAEQVDVPKEVSATDVAKLNPSPTSILSDEAVDALIEKVAELSEKYRNNVDGTVEDIQKMINSDKTLPRLTRGEIIELLDNLTQTDPEGWRKKVNKNRQEYQRAIMLVMPYTPKNTDNFNMEVLYTKPPITHIIGSETPKSTTTPKPYKNIQILGLEPSTSSPPIVRRPIKPNKLTKPVEVKREEAIDVKPKEQVVIKQIPEKQESPVVVHKPVPTKPSRFANHRYPEETDFVASNQGMRVITAPTLISKPDADYWHYGQKDNKPETEIKPQRFVRPNTMQSSVYIAASTTSRPRVRSTVSTTTTISTQSPLSNFGIPEDMKDVIKGINVDMVEPFKSNKFSSQYDASLINFPKQEQTTENVRELLDSIGVFPGQFSTSTPVPDISEIADTLSPDMRELLMSFGLIEDPNPIKPITAESIPEKIHISPQAYTQFKPLPDSAPSRKDMEEFLAGFGLTGNSQRSAKDIIPVEMPTQLSDVPKFHMEMIPESMHDVLEDIGLSKKKARKLPVEELHKTNEKTHVFNPEKTYVSEGEIKRLNQLLETIKRLEKLTRTATPEDLKNLDIENIKELTNIFKQDANIPLDQQYFGPNPLDFDLSHEKNEVKRQQSTTTTEVAVTSTEESKNGNLAALEESFGGPSGVGTQIEDASLPPPRKTGFYYLVDWNTFLEVGEEGRNKVNIRFSPQAGDASRFLKVTVP